MIETKQVPQREVIKEYTTFVKGSCDICKKITTKKGYDGLNWDEGNYNFDHITLKRESGTFYPEGGYKNTIEFDICDECWDNKLIPFLDQFKAVPRETDEDT